tara:strand:- start:1841 stop:2449 length:609 start_codon:yes stop_codon:yes gene_type:complete
LKDIDFFLNNAAAYISSKLPRKKPKTNFNVLVITGVDFPLDPAALIGLPQEQVYIIRSVAGLIPPANSESDLSVMAALEYGVKIRKTRHIIQMAHNDCNIINALLNPHSSDVSTILNSNFLPRWLMLTSSLICGSMEDENLGSRRGQCAEELLRIGFENLMTYPWILDPVWSGKIGLHGWHINEEMRGLSVFSPKTDEFRAI